MSTFSELIDFTRSSTGTYLDSVVYGDELVTNGTFDTDTSSWTVAGSSPLFTWNANGYIELDRNGGSSCKLQQTLSTQSEKTYKCSFSLLAVAPKVGVLIDGALEFEATATGDYVFYFSSGTSNSTALEFSLLNSSTATATIDNVSVVEVTSTAGGTPLLRTADTNEPRLEYDASGQPLGLLIEEQRTNKITESNFNNVTKQSVTTANDYAVAPDGTNTAVAMFETTNNNFHRAYSTTSYGNGVVYTQSVFLKSIGGRAGQLTMTASGFGTIHANFDLINGVVGTKNNCESQITPVGNGWYRCSITATAIGDSGGDASVVSVTSPTSTRLQNYAGDTSKGLLVYGLQVETGAFPTSYIPTSGSTVTRNKDACSLPLERYHHNAQSYTMYAEFQSSPKVPSDYERVWVLSNDDSPSDYVQLQYNTTSKMQVYSRYNNSANGNVSNIEVTDTTNKIALKVDGTVMRLACNGVLRQATLSNAIEDFTKLTIGASDSISIPLNSHIKVIQSYAKGLTDAQLIDLTKPSSSPTMSLTFDGQATSELVEGLHD